MTVNMLHYYINTNKTSICESVTSPGKGYALSMWQVALRDALKAERRARYRAFLSPISCWPCGMAPGPALLKELAALTLSSKLDKWNVIQLWRRPKEAGRHTQHWHTTDDTVRHKCWANVLTCKILEKYWQTNLTRRCRMINLHAKARWFFWVWNFLEVKHCFQQGAYTQKQTWTVTQDKVYIKWGL